MLSHSYKPFLYIALFVAILLSIPLITMQFTNEVSWNYLDFIVAAALFFGSGTTLNYIWRKVEKSNLKILLSISIVLLLLVVWIELAVGIFGN